MPNMFYDYKRSRKIAPSPIRPVMNNLMENSQ